jgi:TPR repeat protein
MRIIELLVVLTAIVQLASTEPAAADANADASAAFKRGDDDAALKIWKPLAEQGDPIAEFGLGVMYTTGRGVPQDAARGVEWIRRAAEQRVPRAALLLGLAYQVGIGTKADPVQADKWMHIALALSGSYVESVDAKLLLSHLEPDMTADQLAMGKALAIDWLNKHSTAPAVPKDRGHPPP